MFQLLLFLGQNWMDIVTELHFDGFTLHLGADRWETARYTSFNCWFIVIVFVCLPGVEDGQTVRMPLGNKEIFITFKVSTNLSVLSPCNFPYLDA